MSSAAARRIVPSSRFAVYALAAALLLPFEGCSCGGSRAMPGGKGGSGGGAGGSSAGASGHGGAGGRGGAGGTGGGGAAGGGGTGGSVGTGGSGGGIGGSGGAAGSGGSAGGAGGTGGPIDGGTDGAACDGSPACAVAGSLSGLLWQLPCTGAVSGAACPTTSAMQTATLAGTAGATYDVALRFRGVVEQKTYSNGCNDGSYWLQGGADNGDSYNVYRLSISSPPQTYFLNAGASSITHLYAIDFQETVRIDAGATVTLAADPKDGQEIINVGSDGVTPLTVAGTSVTQPYNGQFIQMDVLDVTVDPIASSSTIGGSAGGALAFDGSIGQMLEAPDAPSLEPASLTFESWFTFSGAVGAYATIAGKTYQGGSADSMSLWFQDGGLHGGVNINSTAGTSSVAWTAAANQWHHTALVYDSGANKTTLYIDGSVVACAAANGPITYDSHPFVVGGDIENGSPNGFWSGTLDEVRLFSTVRTPAQVWADMHTRTLGPTTGLVAEWTFDEGSGQTTADHSGAGNTATLGATSAAEASDPTWATSTAPH